MTNEEMMEKVMSQKFKLPAYSTWIVRKLDEASGAIKDIATVTAHRVNVHEPSTIEFYDVVIDEESGVPASRVKRIIFNVEDVEEVVQAPKSKILH